MATTSANGKFWLLKAEPDSRVVKGKDVKFSVDDFEQVKTSPWEGVRNYEARNLMKEMKVGEKALFYHSNTKIPGIAAFAEVSKEAYPDYTAWDSSHPYYDLKSDIKNPKWFMVDLTFAARAKHFVPLSLLRFIADVGSAALPEALAYIGDDGMRAIKGMDLVTRGRLSVQRVEEQAWNAVVKLAETGGWEELDLTAKKKSGAGPKKTPVKTRQDVERKSKAPPKGRKAEVISDNSEELSTEEEDSDDNYAGPSRKSASTPRKRKAKHSDDDFVAPSRPSRRARK